ncbi:hypothetical protein [Deinococcus aquaedulcis]|uniref:hypothetical protein n=1 Tax=Deinococcus aquaedulcis TaxID=2840455 RepID=UPI001C838DB8|nr:hypothetical protein [Deinococcus aquaedulcis]
MLRRWAALGLLTLSVSAGAGGGHAPLPAAAQTQAVRTLVAQTDAARGQFVVFSGSSVPCIVDAAFQVDTWTDRRGVVRRLFFSATNLLEGGRTEYLVYWDASGHPRYLSQSQLLRAGPTAGPQPSPGGTTRTELFIDPSGRVVQRLEQGPITEQDRVLWPQILQNLRPADLVKELTCPPTR